MISSNEIRKIANKIQKVAIEMPDELIEDEKEFIDKGIQLKKDDKKELINSLSKCADSSNKIINELKQLQHKISNDILNGDFGQNKRYGYNLGNRCLMEINHLEDKFNKIYGAYNFAIYNRPDGIAASLKEFVEK
jgi:hypothetical protein